MHQKNIFYAKCNAQTQFTDMLVTLFACMSYLMEIPAIASGVVSFDNALAYTDFDRKKERIY